MLSPDSMALPPSRGYTVNLAVINGAKSHMPASMLVDPPLPGQHYLHLSCYSFLVTSSHRDQRLLFDLAFMPDHETRMPPAIARQFASAVDLGGVDALTDIPTTLTAQNVPLSSIDSIVWSHAHIDHIGDPSAFPTSTRLLVGPGFRTAYLPGYPQDLEGRVPSSAFAERELVELDFGSSSSSPTLTVAGFPAWDVFDDASFFLLHTPGHTPHHLSALARTTEDSWVFLAGDAAHHIGQLRPSTWRPLPESVDASTLGRRAPPERCSCTHLRPLLRAGKEGDTNGNGALYKLAAGMHEDLAQAEETVERLKALDGRDDVLVVLAHDESLLETLRFFPETMNAWRAEGWGEKGRWAFLRQLEQFVGDDKGER